MNRREQRGFPDRSLLAFPVAHDDDHSVRTALNAPGQCNSQAHRQPVAKRAGRPFDSRRTVWTGLFREAASGLRESVEECHRKETAVGEGREQGGGRVAFAENQAVAIGVVGVFRINGQHARVGRHEYVHA